MASFLDPLLRSGGSSLALTNTRHNRVVARTLLTAFDSKSRRQGLLQHASLPDDSALIIAPSNAIHTFSMRFVIDVAFVARDGRVLKLRRDMPPRRIAAAWRGVCGHRVCGWRSRANRHPPGDTLQIAAAARLIRKSACSETNRLARTRRIATRRLPNLGDDHKTLRMLAHRMLPRSALPLLNARACPIADATNDSG